MIVVAALILREGRLLICQRRADDRFPLKWEFPGGKVAPGESPEEALVRELREELAVSATIHGEVYRTLHRYAGTNAPLDLRFHTASIGAATPRNHAFAQILWVEPDQLPAFDFLPADRELIELLANGKLKF